MKTLSIIITCFNGWKYMENCLKSLENQTVIPDEVIIVDDCSTDDTFNQLKNYQAKSKLNIKIIKNEVNSGPGVSRENGLKNATMDHVAFCDCDDWYELNFVEEIKKKIIGENADVYIFDNYIAYEDGRRIIAHTTEWLLNAKKKEILGLYSMSLWRFVFSKDILKMVEHSNLYYAEDAIVALQAIANAENIVVIDVPYYNYLFRENSASNKPSPKIFNSFKAAFDIIHRKIGENYPQEDEFIGIKMLCYGSTLNAFKAGIPNAEVKALLGNFEKEYPNWQKNKYIPTLGRIKGIYLFFIKRKMLFFARTMGMLHSTFIRIRKK